MAFLRRVVASFEFDVVLYPVTALVDLRSGCFLAHRYERNFKYYGMRELI